MIYIAVFLVSLSSIAYEVLLTRVFSIGQWNHLSFMVISIALFGFGASGTFLAIIDTRCKGWEKQLSQQGPLIILIFLYVLTTSSAYLIINEIHLDYFRLPIEPIQIVYLMTVYLILSVPFFFTGIVISTGFAAVSERAGLIYFSSMIGSALGAFLPVPFLSILGEGQMVILVSMVPLIFLFIPLRQQNEKFCKFKPWMPPAAGLCFLILGAMLIAGKLMGVEVSSSPYKALSHMLRFPNTEVVKKTSGIRGSVQQIQSPYARFAPGLSLKFTGTIPNQNVVFRDADNPFYLYERDHSNNFAFSRYMLSYSGYLMNSNPQQVLVIQMGGGLAIPMAIASGASKIEIVEAHPRLAEIVAAHYDLPVVNENPRSFLKKCRKKYSLIHLENWGTSIPGTAALNQEHMLNRDAFASCIGHLTKTGVIIISRKLLLPPADMIRLWATAYESLEIKGCNNPENHLAVLRNYDTFTLVVSASPIRNSSKLANFLNNMNFDIVYLPRMDPEDANRFNVFDKPLHYEKLQELKDSYLKGEQNKYFDKYLLDVKVQSDNRPFPSRFLKWVRLKDLYRSTGSRIYGLLLSGEIVMAVVFIEALLVAFFLLVLPIPFISKGGPRPGFFHVLFFLGIGGGFMFAEIFFIKSFTLLFGEPVIAFTVVLSGLLVFSGAGGFLSEKMKPSALNKVLGSILVLFVCFFLFFGLSVNLALNLIRPMRYIIAFLLMLPAGVLMGIPFSLGMKFLLNTPLDRVYAWAGNGCASVLTSILSAQIALSHGIDVIMLFALASYFFALLGAIKKSSET